MSLLAAGTLVLLAAGSAPDAVFDVKAILAPPLEARVLTSREADGIVTEEVTFHSEDDGARRVEIFAFFSYPKGGQRLPAYVWNQGGGARAEAEATVAGARRGYATLCIDLPIPGYRSTGAYPIVDGLVLTDDARLAPIAHGSVALLRAVSFLASRAEVDPARIGMVGSSWGGFFATLQAGLDPRLRAAASLFGSGRLDLGNPWWDARGKKTPPDAAYRERWRTTLDPAARLSGSKVPVAWFSGTNDQFYWMPSLSRTFEAAAAPKHLALIPGWDHAVDAVLDAEVFAWLDAQLKGGPALPAVGALAITSTPAGHRLRFDATPGPAHPLASAELLVSAGAAGHWSSRCWARVPATLGAEGAQAALAESSLPLWVSGSVVDGAGFRASTAIATIAPRASRAAPPVCDGAAAWGDFEAGAGDYLERSGLKVPEWSTDAAAGKRAARFTGNVGYPLYYTAGVPHRLAFRVKAERATEIVVHVTGRFDGTPLDVQERVGVETRWSDVVLAVTPPESALGSLSLRLQIPPGASILVDEVSFRSGGGAP